MSDRHVQHTGHDYGDAFLSLLPQGQAWRATPGTTLERACRGLAEYWGNVDERACHLLRNESDPNYTLEMLPDWERNWGLPDPCYEAPQSIDARRAALIARMTMVGQASRQFFIDLAAMLNYTITITEFRTFVVGIDRVGDARTIGGTAPHVPAAPTDILWAGTHTVTETASVGTVVGGALSAVDPSTFETHTFSMPDTAGGRFGISGDGIHVVTTSTLDYEAANVHNITIRVTDIDGLTFDKVFAVAVSEVGEAPTGIIWAGTHIVAENASIGTVVGGALSFVDPDVGETGTFTLPVSSGGKFAVSGTNIVTAGALDFETTPVHSITIRFTDSDGLTTDSIQSINVTNIVETAEVLLRLPFDGADGATATTDTSTYARPVTFFGSAQLDTAQKPYGTSSLLLGVAGSYITLPDSNDWNFTTFAIEGFARIPAGMPDEKYVMLNRWTGGSVGSFNLMLTKSGSIRAMTFQLSTDGINPTWTMSSPDVGSTTIQDDTWFYWCVERDATNKLRMFAGNFGGTTTMVGYINLATGVMFNSSEPLGIGGPSLPDVIGIHQSFNGWLKDIRIIPSARWASDASFATPGTITALATGNELMVSDYRPTTRTSEVLYRNEWGNPLMNARGDEFLETGELSEWPYYGLGSFANRSYWQVHVAGATLTWFRCGGGQCGVDPHLRIGILEDIECLLDRWKQGHTEIIYDYSGIPRIELTSNTLIENSAEGTVIGTLSVVDGSGTYTLNITDDAGGRVKLVGTSLQAGPTNSDAEATASFTIIVHADNGVGSEVVQVFTVYVLNAVAVVLPDLTLSSATIVTASAEDTVVGTLSGMTAGSTVELFDSSSNRFKLTGNNIVAGPVATNVAVATTHNITVRETFEDASNSPHDTVFPIAVVGLTTSRMTPDAMVTSNAIRQAAVPGVMVNTR